MTKEKQSHCVSVRFTPSEVEGIRRLCGKQTLGGWCRKTILGTALPVVPAVNQEAYRESARWAGALTQLAKDANLGRVIDEEGLRAVLKSFRLALVGVKMDESED